MTIKDTIIEDWKNNWGNIIASVGLIILVGVASYNAGLLNGKVELCTQQGGTLVQNMSKGIECSFTYVQPSTETYLIPLNTTGGLYGLQPNTIQ